MPPLESTPTPTVSEREFVELLRGGDVQAYERLVSENIARMLQVARRIVRDEHEAQDAVQDAFLSAYNAIARFDGRSSLGTWLHRIVVNASLMRLRKRKSRHEVLADDLMPRFRQDGHHEHSPVEILDPRGPDTDRIAAHEAVWKAIDQLPGTLRDILVMRDIEGLDTAESAEVLGISPDAAKQRLHRARQALIALLGKSGDGDMP